MKKKKTKLPLTDGMIQGLVYLFFNVKSKMPMRHPIKLSSRQAQAREKKI